MLRARLPSIFSTSSKMPRLPRNLHPVATWCSPANAICKKTRNKTRCCACHAKWRWTRPKCCACQGNWNASSGNVANVLLLPNKMTFDRYKKRLNVTKCHACHAKRNNETFETSKNDPFSIGTAIRPSRERLRTVALRTVANVNATSSEHNLNPQTPRVKRKPFLRIREK